jgi:hypothetical protein
LRHSDGSESGVPASTAKQDYPLPYSERRLALDVHPDAPYLAAKCLDEDLIARRGLAPQRLFHEKA